MIFLKVLCILCSHFKWRKNERTASVRPSRKSVNERSPTRRPLLFRENTTPTPKKKNKSQSFQSLFRLLSVFFFFLSFFWKCCIFASHSCVYSLITLQDALDSLVFFKTHEKRNEKRKKIIMIRQREKKYRCNTHLTCNNNNYNIDINPNGQHVSISKIPW